MSDTNAINGWCELRPGRLGLYPLTAPPWTPRAPSQWSRNPMCSCRIQDCRRTTCRDSPNASWFDGLCEFVEVTLIEPVSRSHVPSDLFAQHLVLSHQVKVSELASSAPYSCKQVATACSHEWNPAPAIRTPVEPTRNCVTQAFWRKGTIHRTV